MKTFLIINFIALLVMAAIGAYLMAKGYGFSFKIELIGFIVTGILWVTLGYYKKDRKTLS